MSDTNNLTIRGRVVKNADLKYTPNGKAVCNFAIANNESNKKADGSYENVASFFDIAIWGRYAESMHKYLIKGRGVIISGRLKQDRWTKDGQTQSRIHINAQTVELLPEANKSQSPANYNDNIPNEDTPF